MCRNADILLPHGVNIVARNWKRESKHHLRNLFLYPKANAVGQVFSRWIKLPETDDRSDVFSSLLRRVQQSDLDHAVNQCVDRL